MVGMDVVAVRKEIVAFLGEFGFAPRDADITDLQHGLDSSLRFKVGTSHQEVAIIVIFRDIAPNRVIRLTRAGHVSRVEKELREIIDRHWLDNPPGVQRRLA